MWVKAPTSILKAINSSKQWRKSYWHLIHLEIMPSNCLQGCGAEVNTISLLLENCISVNIICTYCIYWSYKIFTKRLKKQNRLIVGNTYNCCALFLITLLPWQKPNWGGKKGPSLKEKKNKTRDPKAGERTGYSCVSNLWLVTSL